MKDILDRLRDEDKVWGPWRERRGPDLVALKEVIREIECLRAALKQAQEALA